MIAEDRVALFVIALALISVSACGWRKTAFAAGVVILIVLLAGCSYDGTRTGVVTEFHDKQLFYCPHVYEGEMITVEGKEPLVRFSWHFTVKNDKVAGQMFNAKWSGKEVTVHYVMASSICQGAAPEVVDAVVK